VVIERLIIGGENEDWKIPARQRSTFADADNN